MAMSNNNFGILIRPIGIINKYFAWKKTESEFLEFIEKWKSKRDWTNELRGNIAVVIQPWVMTATPWFLIAIALFFTQSNRKVTIILDDYKFVSDKLFFNIQLKSIKKVLSSLPRQIKIIELRNLRKNAKSAITQNANFIGQLSTLNTIHFMRGELIEYRRKENFEALRKQLESSYEKINILFQENHFDFIIVAGGIWGSSGLYLKHAELDNIRTVTIDSGFGTILINTIGIAAHQSDLPVAFSQLEDIYTDTILDIAEKEMEKRKLGIDKYNTQLTLFSGASCNESQPRNGIGFLLLLNIPWDSAALGLHQAFEDTPEWVIETIQWLLENSDEMITIRQHPHERTVFGKSNDDYQMLITQKFGNNDRIRFISAVDEVNTYNLIENSRCVITFSTTTAMEAVAMGKVVVNVSSCYYSDLGFVYNSKTKEEYFRHLKDAINGRITVSKKQKEDALKCYYLSQCCNRIDTIFTPQPADFKKWVKMDPEDVFQMNEVKTLLYAFENGVPISLLRHYENMKPDIKYNTTYNL